MYGLERAGAFLSRFPWLGFLLQAPQALYSLTGYGLVLGSVMGFLTDAFWAPVRLLSGETVRVQGPPPSDPIGKAARYLTQPGYHYAQSDFYSYEDHWLLTAADIVATGLLMREFKASRLLARADVITQTPVIGFTPWYTPTVSALRAEGYSPELEQVGPLEGLTARTNYLEVTQRIAAEFPGWIDRVAAEFPPTFETTAFSIAMFEAGEAVLDWLNDGERTAKPIFDPLELTVARCFEFGIFPAFDPAAEQVQLFAERALQLAAAGGKELPGPIEMKRAASEAWGGFVSR